MTTATALIEDASLMGVQAWADFDPGRQAVTSVPADPGLIRITGPDGRRTVVLVLNLREWFVDMREDLLASQMGADPQAVGAQWRTAGQAELVDLLGGDQRTGPLKPGRPRKVHSPEEAPTAWGVYRIHRKADDTWYVGISSDLRNRLRRHIQTELFQPIQGDHAEILLAQEPSPGRVVVWQDMMLAEAREIQKIKEAGKAAVNVTRGGNGRPPNLPINFAGTDQIPLPGLATSPLRVPRRSHVDLAIRWLTVQDDWNVWLRGDDVLCAVPGTHGPTEQQRSAVAWADVVELYRAAHGRNLDDDLAQAGRATPAPRVEVIYWNPDPRIKDSTGQRVLDPRDVDRITGEDVRRQRLPQELTDQGLAVDPAHARSGGMNPVMRITADESTALWAKAEENPYAVDAELLASGLLAALRWPGLVGRVKATQSGSVVLAPETGAGDIHNEGAFRTAKRFRWLPDEHPESLRAARAFSLKRISLADLRLHNDADALRLLLFDAAIGNSDRHAGNLNYGRVRDSDPFRCGYLLPYDHGRSFLNSNPLLPGNEPDDPAAIVTGSLPYANPNQLLRPTSEYLAGDRTEAQAVAEAWLAAVARATLAMREGWTQYEAELTLVGRRAMEIASDCSGFLDQVTAVVL